jgi:hypothetical protein
LLSAVSSGKCFPPHPFAFTTRKQFANFCHFTPRECANC